MRGRDGLDEFVTARAQDLHHDAFVLTASQAQAEQLVAVVLAELSRERIDFAQAATTARLRMARTVARASSALIERRGNEAEEVYRHQVPARFGALASLTDRQRAILLLEAVDGYDLRPAARALQLKAHDLEEAYAAIPPELTDTDRAELRSLLQDFGDLAETPDAGATLADIRAVPPPPRRPWWSYAAAVLVVALTVSTLWITQTWHNDWLRTAAGLNNTYGTHFPAYAQGYKLVGIQEVTTDVRQGLVLGARSALAFGCLDGRPDGSGVAQVVTGADGNYTAQCGAAGHTRLMPTTGETLLTFTDPGRAKRPVAIYRKAPWGGYPVATSGFIVETGGALHLGEPVGPDMSRTPVRGPVLTVRGTPGHPNGTFTGSVALPPGSSDDQIVLGGLLSPTTSGRFQVSVTGGEVSPMQCSSLDRVDYLQDYSQVDPWCEIYGKRVPQVPFAAQLYAPTGKSVTVQITVQHALGPWTLQVVAGGYRAGQNR